MKSSSNTYFDPYFNKEALTSASVFSLECKNKLLIIFSDEKTLIQLWSWKMRLTTLPQHRMQLPKIKRWMPSFWMLLNLMNWIGFQIMIFEVVFWVFILFPVQFIRLMNIQRENKGTFHSLIRICSHLMTFLKKFPRHFQLKLVFSFEFWTNC